MSETRVIVIPEGKTCDYFDVNSAMIHRKSTLDIQLKNVLLVWIGAQSNETNI